VGIKQFIRPLPQLHHRGQGLNPFQKRNRLLSLPGRVHVAKATDLWTWIHRHHLSPRSFSFTIWRTTVNLNSRL
jgi:hypothetical protein